MTQQDGEGEGPMDMDEEKLSQNQATARRLGLPRVVWEAMPYRVVEYYSDDDDRIGLALERWDGDDRMGQSRWSVVQRPDRYGTEGAHADAGHWEAAFWALGTPLFVSDEEAERRRAEDERQRRLLEERHSYDPW